MGQPVPVRSAPYIQKTGARYRDTSLVANQSCAKCQLYVAGTGTPPAPIQSTCKVVIGRIFSTGYCRYFDGAK